MVSIVSGMVSVIFGYLPAVADAIDTKDTFLGKKILKFLFLNLWVGGGLI